MELQYIDDVLLYPAVLAKCCQANRKLLATHVHYCELPIRKKVNGSKRFRGGWHEDRSRISFRGCRIEVRMRPGRRISRMGTRLSLARRRHSAIDSTENRKFSLDSLVDRQIVNDLIFGQNAYVRTGESIKRNCSGKMRNKKFRGWRKAGLKREKEKMKEEERRGDREGKRAGGERERERERKRERQERAGVLANCS